MVDRPRAYSPVVVGTSWCELSYNASCSDRANQVQQNCSVSCSRNHRGESLDEIPATGLPHWRLRKRWFHCLNGSANCLSKTTMQWKDCARICVQNCAEPRQCREKSVRRMLLGRRLTRQWGITMPDLLEIIVGIMSILVLRAKQIDHM